MYVKITYRGYKNTETLYRVQTTSPGIPLNSKRNQTLIEKANVDDHDLEIHDTQPLSYITKLLKQAALKSFYSDLWLSFTSPLRPAGLHCSFSCSKWQQNGVKNKQKFGKCSFEEDHHACMIMIVIEKVDRHIHALENYVYTL